MTTNPRQDTSSWSESKALPKRKTIARPIRYAWCCALLLPTAHPNQRPIPLRFSMGRTLRVRAWLPPGSWKEQSFPLPTNKSPPVHAPLPCSNRISLPWTPAATLASPSESMTHRVVALPKYSLTLIGTLNRRTECHDLHSFSSRHGIVFPRLETRHAGSYPFLGRCRRVLAVLPRP